MQADMVKGWHNAARAAGTSVRRLREMVKAGEIQAQKGEDGKWHFSPDVLADFRSSQEEPISSAIRAHSEDSMDDTHTAAPQNGQAKVSAKPVEPHTPQAGQATLGARPVEPPPFAADEVPDISEVPPPPEPAPTKATKQKKQAKKMANTAAVPSPPTPSTKVRKLLGVGERLRFYKCKNISDVEGAYLNEYKVEDLEKLKVDVETFVQSYLLPDHGEGRYKIVAHDYQGRAVAQEFKTVLDPHKPSVGPSAGPGGTAHLVQDRLIEKLSETEKENREFLKDMLKTASGKGGSIDPMVLMMLMKQDSGGLASIKEELRRVSQPQPTAPALPPPPPPPPPDTGVKDIVSVLGPIIEKSTTPPPKNGLGAAEITSIVTSIASAVTPIFTALMNRKDPDIEFMKQTIGELKQQLSEPGRGIDDVIGEYQKIKEITKSERKDDHDNVWSFMRDFFDNFDRNIGALGGLADKINQKNAANRQLPSGEQAKPQNPPEAPEAFQKAIKKLDTAEADGDRVFILVESLYALGQSQAFRPHAEKMLKHAKAGEQEETMTLVRVLLRDSAQQGYCTEEASKAALAAVEQNFEEITSYLNAPKEAAS